MTKRRRQATLFLFLAVVAAVLLLSPAHARAEISEEKETSKELDQRVEEQIAELNKWIDEYISLSPLSSLPDELLERDLLADQVVHKKPSDLWEVRRVFQDEVPWRLNLGVFAKTDITSDTTLSYIDFSKVYTYRWLTHDFKDMSKVYPEDHWKENGLDDITPLSLWMLLHRNFLAKQSYLHPYLSTLWMLFDEFPEILPLSSWGSNPGMVEIKRELMGHSMFQQGYLPTSELHEITRESFEMLQDELFSHDVASLGLSPLSSWRDVIPSEDVWRVAMHMIGSRCWGLGDHRGYIPGFDFYNHDPIKAQAGISLTSSMATMTTYRSIKQGEEIFISYGQHSSSGLMSVYGYVPEENRADGILFRARTDLLPHKFLREHFDDLFLVVQRNEETRDIHHQYMHRLHLDANQVPWQLIDFFRLVVVDDLMAFNITEEKYQWLIDTKEIFTNDPASLYKTDEVVLRAMDSPLDLAHEMRAFKETIFCIDQFMNSFDVPIEEVKILHKEVQEKLKEAADIFHNDLGLFRKMTKEIQDLEMTFNVLNLRLAMHTTLQSIILNTLDAWQVLLLDTEAIPDLAELFFSIDLDILDTDLTTLSFSEPPRFD